MAKTKSRQPELAASPQKSPGSHSQPTHKNTGNEAGAEKKLIAGTASQSAAQIYLAKVGPWTAIICGFLLLLGSGVTAWAYNSQGNAILKNVTIAGQPVGGLDTLTAMHQVENKWNQFSQRAYTFTSGSKKFTISAGGSADSDEQVILDLVDLDVVRAANKAQAFGHTGPWWQQTRERLSSFLGREHQFGTIAIDTATIAEEIHRQLVSQEVPAIDAGLQITDDGKMNVTASSAGKSFDYARALIQVKQQTKKLDPATITINQIVVQPEVPVQDGLQSIAEQQTPALLAVAPVTITDNEKKWTIEKDQLQKLLGWQRQGNNIIVSFDSAKTIAWLNSIKAQAETQPQNARFSISATKVEEFQASVVGRLIDTAATLTQMREDIVLNKKNTSSLIMQVIKPVTDTTSTNNLGITELVAEGRTDFKRSPTNRKYNLTYGSKILNGLMIAPGETFSLVTALGKIDGAHGWKPELVIKGTDIKPEFGGGLCQVATTLFRTILNAGLPVLERKNHSLRISYYEPPVGLDATIFEPKPDLKFKNDYPGYLLLQTRIEGTVLIYSFYGTKDGRTVDIPEPKVYNRTGIPPTINTEVDDLKPGEKVCQTPGHPGADATATYTVTKADGTKVTQVFQSHYRPLPVICRVGKAKTAKAKPPTNTTAAATAR